jgi:hypothetical protein
MSKLLTAFLIGSAIGVGFANLRGEPSSAGAQGTATVTMRAVTAANAFLTSLEPSQKGQASYAYTEPIKSKWHNLPPQMSNRAGIRLADLTVSQRQAAEAVIHAVLSAYGEQKVRSIMAADQYLGEEMGAAFPTGPGAYMLAVFGTPSTTTPWEVQFNGHHLGVNVTFIGATHVLAPTLTAAYPNMYTAKDNKKVVVLADEADRALKLIQALDGTQKARAILQAQMWDFLLGPGHDDHPDIQPEGLKGSDMTAAQRQMLVDVAAAWVNIIDEQTAAAKLADVRRNLDNTYFLWSGDTTTSGNAYFRVQGPTIWIEYSPQTLGGPGSATGRRGGGDHGASPAAGDRGGVTGDRGRGNFEVAMNPATRKLDPIHVHTIYRDFTNDYGKASARPF